MSGARLATIAPGVHAWIGAGGDSNAGAVETPHGLIAIDAQQNRALAEEFRATLSASIGRPLRALVNTHFHIDHIAGNVAFTDVPILAHDRTLRALDHELGALPTDGATTADPLSKARMFFGGNFEQLVPEGERGWFIARVGGASPLEVRPPTDTFEDRFDIHLPNDTLHLEYWGPAHCDGDLVIHLEKARVAFLGDLLFNGRFPWLGDCDLDRWIGCLERILAMDLRTVVPGHGPPATLQDVASFRDLLAAVRSAVDAAIKSGLSEEAAAREVAIPAYASMQRYKEWMPFNVRAAYRYLRGR
jgi:glyoxylase-like metal-dependent hydrolase (beta-lactamase superfamily II)